MFGMNDVYLLLLFVVGWLLMEENRPMTSEHMIKMVKGEEAEAAERQKRHITYHER